MQIEFSFSLSLLWQLSALPLRLFVDSSERYTDNLSRTLDIEKTIEFIDWQDRSIFDLNSINLRVALSLSLKLYWHRFRVVRREVTKTIVVTPHMKLLIYYPRKALVLNATSIENLESDLMQRTFVCECHFMVSYSTIPSRWQSSLAFSLTLSWEWTLKV